MIYEPAPVPTGGMVIRFLRQSLNIIIIQRQNIQHENIGINIHTAQCVRQKIAVGAYTILYHYNNTVGIYIYIILTI